MSDEQQRVESLSDWYLKEQLDFDKRLIRFRYDTLKPFLVGARGLELGPAEGEMSQFLINDFESLTVVDGASELLVKISNYGNLIKVHSLFEEYIPVMLLERVRNWLAPVGKLFIRYLMVIPFTGWSPL